MRELSIPLALIPIEQQPFYEALVEKSAAWDEVVLDHVVGDSPRATLLNFYAVMSDVALRADLPVFILHRPSAATRSHR